MTALVESCRIFCNIWNVQWEEYMRRRKEKEGVVKDLAGNVIEDAKPSYAVQVLLVPVTICLKACTG